MLHEVHNHKGVVDKQKRTRRKRHSRTLWKKMRKLIRTPMKASDLVRLALFTEHRRAPLRRDEITKKVLGSKSRVFPEVYSRAQDILRKTFGMELVELQSRSEGDDDPNQKEKNAMGLKKKATSSGTKTYILRSMLDPALIERACAPNSAILNVEQTEGKVGTYNDDDDDDNRVGTRSTGSIFAWHHADELGSVGILYVILALVLVNGRAISDNDLRALLKRLRLSATAPIPLSSQSTHQNLTTDAYLLQLIRQGYLDRRKIGEQKGAAGGKKRGRAAPSAQAANGDDDSNTFEWRWGPRAMSEIGEVGIAQFVAAFMVQRRGNVDDDDDEGDREDAAMRRQIEKMVQGIEKAASGRLLDITGR
ncbi:unnamed protein product [Somion occarium]|uniref:MAGE domain-containing protein n=1 Tax=Somion occarium TaxID=3059160 RepID=A0ABP1D1U6_9APHY